MNVLNKCKISMHLFFSYEFILYHDLKSNMMRIRLNLKPTQSHKSLVISGIVLKNKFTNKRYETVLYTCNI